MNNLIFDDIIKKWINNKIYKYTYIYLKKKKK